MVSTRTPDRRRHSHALTEAQVFKALLWDDWGILDGSPSAFGIIPYPDNLSDAIIERSIELALPVVVPLPRSSSGGIILDPLEPTGPGGGGTGAGGGPTPVEFFASDPATNTQQMEASSTLPWWIGWGYRYRLVRFVCPEVDVENKSEIVLCSIADMKFPDPVGNARGDAIRDTTTAHIDRDGVIRRDTEYNMGSVWFSTTDETLSGGSYTALIQGIPLGYLSCRIHPTDRNGADVGSAYVRFVTGDEFYIGDTYKDSPLMCVVHVPSPAGIKVVYSSGPSGMSGGAFVEVSNL